MKKNGKKIAGMEGRKEWRIEVSTKEGWKISGMEERVEGSME